MAHATVTLKLKDEKKHSVRYDADPSEQDPIVTNIYANKIALPRGRYPEQVTVTVEWEE